ncbi:hypothetical protein HJB67_31960 [Rhizobium lentis]|nr:hypothetical protein [Rhizobium lentis]
MALLTLVGLIVQGFKRLERLIVYRDMEMVEAGGFVGSTWDSPDMKKAHLKLQEALTLTCHGSFIRLRLEPRRL